MSKILLIEDQEDILDDLKTLLSSENFNVYTAATGENGVVLAKSYQPDLIISDIMLPGIDGYQVFTLLKDDEKTAHIPFIFLTAKVERQDLRKGMGLGADDYIFKPYDADDILKAIKTRLMKHAAIKEKIIHTLKHAPVHNSNHKLEITDSIYISHNKSNIPVKLEEIVCVRAENQYSSILCSNNKTFLIRKSLSEWQDTLPENYFIRIHRAAIIHSKFVKSIDKIPDKNYEVTMEYLTEPLEVSRTYVKNFKNILLRK